MRSLALFCSLTAVTFQPTNLPRQSRQLLVVTAPSWISSNGNLQRYQKFGKQWEPVEDPIPVSLGKSGLAWGRGLHRISQNAPEKHEGDGCAPAGIFAIGPAFGYAARPPVDCKFPYRSIRDRDYFVDDPTSTDYNRWVTIPALEPNDPKKFWRSCEKMRRRDRLYQWGIVIQQNDRPVMKGRGSAIFFHVWKDAGVATVGCTAMARENLVELLKWLDPKQKPLLVQAPDNEIRNLLASELVE
jgi:L,D-peptidoglycan transpeptidase YkuD (ErfK/YbiS/YcfS/YnhG family)